MRSHLSNCPECRELLAFFEDVKDSAPRIERITPPAYLWERISVSLDEHPWGDEETTPANSDPRFSRTITRKINLAGAFLSVVLVTALSLSTGGVTHNSRAVHGVTANHRGQKSDLEYVSLYLMANQNRFPAEVRNYYLNQMEGLNEKIKTIKSALERYPQNHHIKAQLAYVYRQKIELYEKIGLPRTGGSKPVGEFSGDEWMRGGRYE